MAGIIGFVGGSPSAALPALVEALARSGAGDLGEARIVVLDAEQGSLRTLGGRLDAVRALLGNGTYPIASALGQVGSAVPAGAVGFFGVSGSGGLALVGEGVLSNRDQLLAEAAGAGAAAGATDDGGLLVRLLENLYGGDLQEAVERLGQRLEGDFAILALSVREGGRVVALRRGRPLVAGSGGEGAYVASSAGMLPVAAGDGAAAAGPVELENGRAVVLGAQGPLAPGQGPAARPQQRGGQDGAASKGGFPHYMLKEIFEQPEALRRTLAALLDGRGGGMPLSSLPWDPAWFRRLERVVVLGMGTARHAGLVGREAFRQLAGLPVDVEFASEFRDAEGFPLARHTLVVAISQSGETADTLVAVEQARRQSAPVLAVTNVVGSPLVGQSDAVLYTMAGKERAVPSTKAYLAQLATLYALAIYVGRCRGHLAEAAADQWSAALHGVVALVEQVLARHGEVVPAAERLARYEHAYFMGRGLDYPTALEGALKLKEVSYIHAEAYCAAEFKHGTLALVDEGVPVVGLLTQRHLAPRTAANLSDVAQRGAWVWTVAAPGTEAEVAGGNGAFVLPEVAPLLAPLVATVPLQFLAYHTGLARGCDVDQPRNLTKSVTVE